jgi:hypothetical protein
MSGSGGGHRCDGGFGGVNTKSTVRRRLKHTLATRGLEEHFSSCAVVSIFWLWRK